MSALDEIKTLQQEVGRSAPIRGGKLVLKIDVQELGLPLYKTVAGPGGVPIIKKIDYSPAFEAMVEIFLMRIEELVPVDTGYLRGSISARSGGQSAEFRVDAEYAAYVEYGTWKMDAQPYFWPALEEGYAFFLFLAMFLAGMSPSDDLGMPVMLPVRYYNPRGFVGYFGGGGGPTVARLLGEVAGTLLVAAAVSLFNPILGLMVGIFKTGEVISNWGKDYKESRIYNKKAAIQAEKYRKRRAAAIAKSERLNGSNKYF